MNRPETQQQRFDFATLAILLIMAGALKFGLGVARPLFDVVQARAWVQVPVTLGKA